MRPTYQDYRSYGHSHIASFALSTPPLRWFGGAAAIGIAIGLLTPVPAHSHPVEMTYTRGAVIHLDDVVCGQGQCQMPVTVRPRKDKLGHQELHCVFFTPQPVHGNVAWFARDTDAIELVMDIPTTVMPYAGKCWGKTTGRVQ